MVADPLHLTPRLPSPLQEVTDERFARQGVRLLFKRDDLIHPALPGNKWRKLVPNLRLAAEEGHQTLLTFGGAYSNHLRATAAAGRLLGWHTIGVVRGDELARRPLNGSLARCAADGMRLHFVTRAAYRRRAESGWLAELHDRFGDFYPIPEGGSNGPAVRGCAELGAELRGHTDVATVACGTGGTLAGLAAGLANGERPGSGQERRTSTSALGVPVLRGGFLRREVARLQHAAYGGLRGDWRLDDRFHCGGYARTTGELESFARDFEARHDWAALDRVYVTKLLYAMYWLLEERTFPADSTVTAVITG